MIGLSWMIAEKNTLQIAVNRCFCSKTLGFEEFEVIEEFWGENNPCQIYVDVSSRSIRK